ncbi:MAG: S41 family peptidase [Candidatus Binatia bacterium]|nr:S41 family peptidase [Candidatus Binatia bacterium]
MRLVRIMEKHGMPLVLLLVGIALGIFLAGHWVPSVSAVSRQDYESLEVFTNILSIVKKNYVEEVDTKNLVTGAINGMLTGLDPHSAYLTPDLYKEPQMDTQGRFGGLGIEITVKGGMLTVVSPIEDTPAAKAGIKPGDQIFKIEEEFTKDMTLVDAVKKMRGPKGTKITISIKREGVPELMDFSLMRDTIRVQSVRSRKLEEGYGYVRLAQFQERSDRDVQRALEKMAAEKGGIKGLVLDLRNNPGGLLTQAVRVSDLFLDSGLIVYTEGRIESQKQKYSAQKDGSWMDFPIVVLVNGGSASASEIVAGALQDHKRAVVLGTKTFGKGSVQTILPLDDNSALRLTTARYFTPKGRSIQALGIVPDIIAEPPMTPPAESKAEEKKRLGLREENLPGHLPNPQQAPSQPQDQSEKDKEKLVPRTAPTGDETIDNDAQLKRALDLLKSWDVFKQLVQKKAA